MVSGRRTVFFGGLGNGFLDGGTDQDTVVGDDDVLAGRLFIAPSESDNDQLFGGNSAGNLYSEIGDDLLEGGANNGFLSCNEGRDRLFGGTGSDELLKAWNLAWYRRGRKVTD